MARNLSQNLKRIVAGLCAVLVVAGTVPANLGGVKLFDTAITASAEENFSISSVEEWNTFAESVKNGNTYSGKTVMLTADIGSVTTMVEGTFSGIFDGGNHTLTVNISGGSVAVFNTVTNGTIQNLTLAGSVTGTGIHTAALVRSVGGSCTIKNVDINADVNCSGDYIGGFIGHAGTSHTINIENSLFSGNINKTGANKGNFIGAFIGWSQTCTATITNCAFSGSYSNIKSFNNIGFSWKNPTKITVTDFYSNTSDIFVANVNNGVRLYVPESYTALAAQVKSDEGESFYSTFSDALSAWTDNSNLTLLKDVTTASTISVTGTKTLDLNGHGIIKTGSGRVVSVNSGATLTVNDSDPTATHHYTIASPTANGAGLATVNDSATGETVKTFTGGYITGGNIGGDGGGVIVAGTFNMNGGTIIGNNCTGTGGGVFVGGAGKFNMTGGALIGNTAQYGGGVGSSAAGSGFTYLSLTGGVIEYNRSNGTGGGVHMNANTGTTSRGINISIGGTVEITNNHTNGTWTNNANAGGGIVIDGAGSVFTLSGTPTVTGNTAGEGTSNHPVVDNNLYFTSRGTPKVNVGDFTPTTAVGVTMMSKTGVFTKSTNTDYNVAGNFTSDNADYEVIKDSTSKQLKLGVHSHAFNYTADGDTITAECTGEGTCKITDGLTMTISAADATYDGEAHGAELSTGYNTTAFPDNYTIEYYKGSTKFSGAPVNAGDYTAKVTVGNATAAVDYTISKKALTITADPASKTYGKDDPELTYTNTALVAGDTLSGKLARAEGENAGTYKINQGTLSAGDNYEVTFVGADFTIDKAAITITADDKSTKYKDDLAELTYQIGGDYVEGDDLGVTVSTRATKTSPVGDYDIVVGWNSNPNYNAELTNGKYTITKADLTTSATGYDGVYDGEAHSISVDVGDSDAVVYYGTTELTADNYNTAGSTTNPEYTNAGEYTVYYYIESGNYDPQPISGSKTVSIARAEVTVTANAASKTYGDTDPALTYEVSGLIGNDTLTGTLTRAAGEDAGSYAIGASRLSAGNNYDITFVGAVFTINKATLTITADELSKTYGEDDPELTYTVTGLKNGDTISGTLTRARGENAGTYAIGMGGLDVGNNYKVNFTAAVFTINKADLTVTANAASKTYGETDPALTYTTEGLLGDDALTGELAREAGENVGTYAINQGTLSAGNNYNVTFTCADFTINKAALTVTAEAASKTYGKDDPVFAYSTEGLVGADTLTGKLTREAGENVGTYAIKQGTLKASDNYTLTFTGADFTINKAEITITADDKSTKYKDDLAELTYQIGGDYVEGDDLGVTVSTDATKTSPVGEYDITVDWNKNGNYTATLVNGKYTITKADLTTSATGYDGVYDGEAHSISVDVGDSDAVVYYGTSELTADNYNIAGSTLNPEYTDAGEYTVYYFISTGNYDPQPVSGSKTVNIAKADVTVTAEARSKTYGTADPELTYTAEGLVGEETLTGELTREEGENVGTYAITQGTLKASDNYELTFTGADFIINKAALTVTAEAKEKTYGKDDPELTYTAEGLVGEDTVTGELTREAGENVGTYAITQGTFKASDNYELAFTGADFTISKAALTITADDKSSQYLDDIAELTYQVSGDYVEGDDLGVTIRTSATSDSETGEYEITVEYDNGNYEATLVPGKYTITKADLSITASGYDGIYDGEAHGISVTYEGETDAVIYYGTEELTAENFETAGSTENPTYTNAGEYTVYFYIVSKNYEADPVSGSKVVNIAKADAAVKTAPEAVSGLIANGEYQELVTAGETEGGKLVYAVTTDKDKAPADDEYSETIPTATDEGAYYVWYKVIGDENHNDSEPAYVEVKVAAAPADDSSKPDSSKPDSSSKSDSSSSSSTSPIAKTGGTENPATGAAAAGMGALALAAAAVIVSKKKK